MVDLKVNSAINSAHKSLLVPLVISVLTACGGGGSNNTSTPPVETPAPPVAEPDWWDVPAIELADVGERPDITLTGASTILLSIGDQYEELGANVLDPQDGDISSSLQISNDVDTQTAGDYLVQYTSEDSDGNAAATVTRVVRVIDSNPNLYTKRLLGTTAVNMGYIEHLPKDYGESEDAKYPLIIYNHGNGANAEYSPTGQDNALDLVLSNFGPPTLLRAERWDTELPFILLSPQYGYIQDSEPETRLKHFVDFAVRTYQVDPKQVYMMGWSQGGFISLEYAMAHPETLTAVISISAGTPFIGDPPEHFCQLESLPVWAFHGDLDHVVPSYASTDLIDLLNNSCQPQWSPKVTIFSEEYHQVHHFVSDLSAMSGGRFEYAIDEQYDAYDISIYDWLLQFSKDD